MKYIDLHTHTTRSDGTDTPAELIEKAAAAGLSAVAVTDHDTVAGITEARTAGERCGVEVIAGIEFSTGWEGHEIHLLGYFIDIESPALTPALAWVKNDRRERNEKMAAALRADGIEVTVSELHEKYPDSTVGRPHFAVKLIEYARAESVKDAFDKYLSPGRKYYVPRSFIPFADAVCAIRQAGGTAVLAHPFQYELSDKKLRRLIEYGMTLGITAVECQYSGYTPAQEEYLKNLAAEYKLKITGGSDYHGAHKPNIALGVLPVPYDILDSLR